MKFKNVLSGIALLLIWVFLLLFLFAWASLVALANAESATINDTLIVDQWRWVDVVNKGFIDETCGIDRGDKLRIMGIDDGEYLLQVENKRIFYGTRCPCKTLFFMDTAVADSMWANLKRIEEVEKEKKERVDRLLRRWRNERNSNRRYFHVWRDCLKSYRGLDTHE